MKKAVLLLTLTLTSLGGFSQEKPLYDWPIYMFNFGGFNKYEVPEQIELLEKYGYDGISVLLETEKDIPKFEAYYKAANANNNVAIFTAFYRVKYTGVPEFSKKWKMAVDKLEGKNIDLWVIFQRKLFNELGETIFEKELKEMTLYAAKKNVNIVVYPHSGTAFLDAEAALPFVKKINQSNLSLVFNTCHELRANNADRIEEVIENVKNYMSHVVIAGADKVKDTTNKSEMEYSTLKAIYRGNYDLKPIFKKLRDINYKGAIGYINHRFKEDPEFYLPKSMETYKQWIAELNEGPYKGYDAPDQATWHKASNTWFVSNLGGGISLAKDGYGWISRLDSKGNVLDPVWIGLKERMHAPSGMICTDDFLYAVDRDGVYKIDIKAQKVDTFYPIPEGEFLNDITISKAGDLYVSDFFGNKIFKIHGKSGEVEIWLHTEKLEAPDGVYMDEDNLIVGSWGVLSEPGTFNTSKNGSLIRINLKTKDISVISKELGNLEGVTKAGDFFYVTDWASGKVLKVNSKNGDHVELLKGLKHPTDPSFSKETNTLAFPQHGTDQVLFMKLN